ncbi:MAG TPA: hypothetical protein VJ901_02105 [Thermoanaerobaculia bacterium]|nr:hypothetical protein [Thermoanaerobaculia bacterium]
MNVIGKALLVVLLALPALGDTPDPCSNALLLRTLATDDVQLIKEAIVDLGKQHDEAALPLIEKTLDRFPKESTLAFSLFYFRSDAADAVAARHLSALDFADYKQAQGYGLQ